MCSRDGEQVRGTDVEAVGHRRKQGEIKKKEEKRGIRSFTCVEDFLN